MALAYALASILSWAHKRAYIHLSLYYTCSIRYPGTYLPGVNSSRGDIDRTAERYYLLTYKAFATNSGQINDII